MKPRFYNEIKASYAITLRQIGELRSFGAYFNCDVRAQINSRLALCAIKRAAMKGGR